MTARVFGMRCLGSACCVGIAACRPILFGRPSVREAPFLQATGVALWANMESEIPGGPEMRRLISRDVFA